MRTVAGRACSAASWKAHPLRRRGQDDGEDRGFAGSVEHERQREREDVDLEVFPAVHFVRGTHSFQDLEENDEAKK
jgi:hypothetical protein